MIPPPLWVHAPHPDPELKPSRSWLWLAPGLGLGLFVLVVVSLLWILHQHEVEVQRKLSISSDLNGAYTTEIAVADQGKGIDQDLEAQLFSPFYTTKPNGMGIGLNICRSIIELHDGSCGLRATPCGSTFRFTLPTLHQ